MPFQYRKRKSLGKGVGLNLSKSGVSVSKRGKRGSVTMGRKGPSASVRIMKGLSWRKRP